MTLIVLEGPDRVGRSLHASMLSQRLEALGVATESFSVGGSKLIGDQIEDNMSKIHNFGPRTRALLFATDHWDQLIHRILPALDAGLVVIADGYQMTPVIREKLRGTPVDWLNALYEGSPVADKVIVLEAGPRRLLGRVFISSSVAELKGYESGLDLHLDNIPTRSFIKYQRKMRKQFKKFSKNHNYSLISTNEEFAVTHEKIWEEILPVVNHLLIE